MMRRSNSAALVQGDPDAVVAAPVAPRPTGLPTVVRVDLLPPEITEERQFRARRTLLIGVVAGTAAVVVAGVVLSGFGVAGPQDDLTDARARTTELEAQVAELARVPELRADVENLTEARREAMASEVDWVGQLDAIAESAPPTMWITSIQGSIPGSGDDLGTGTDGGGGVIFQGGADNSDTVASWLDFAGEQTFWDSPYITLAEQGDVSGREALSWTGTATLTPDALSNRFAGEDDR